MIAMATLWRHVRCIEAPCQTFIKNPGVMWGSPAALNYSTKVGNRFIRSENESAGLPHRWKKLWYLSMMRKKELEGPDDPMPRSSRRNWNYNAELAAFKLRLDIKCDSELLSTALTEVEDGELPRDGWGFAETFVAHYVSVAFPRLPDQGKDAVVDFLLSTTNIAKVATNLGFQDLMQCLRWPPSGEVVADCFMGVVAAISAGESPVAAGRFILDFIAPQLVGKDLVEDVWAPDNPMEVLVKELGPQKAPEARLVRQSGVNTVTPVFFVALFSDGKVLAESGAESIPLAETDAARTALKKLYAVEIASEAAPMGHRVDDEFLSKLFEPLLASPQAKVPRVDAGG